MWRRAGSGDDRSLYEVLGVGEGASEAEIKAGWRRMLLVVHPDHGGSSAATHEVQRAYALLSDPIRRRDYDRLLAARRNLAGGQGAGGRSTRSESFRVDFDDLLRDMERAAAAAREAAARKAAAEEATRRAAAAREEAAREAAARTAAAREASRRAREQATRNQATWDSTQSSALFCLATTRKGHPCMAQRQKGSQFCYNHDPIRYRSHQGSRTSSTSEQSAGPSPTTGAYPTDRNTAATPSTYSSTSRGGLRTTAIFLGLAALIGGLIWTNRDAIGNAIIAAVSFVLAVVWLCFVLWAMLKVLVWWLRRR
jgi:curved DNA-binding protein CbpA